MVTAVQNKNKTTITISRRLSKSELERIMKYLNYRVVKPKKEATKVPVKQHSDEISTNIWSRLVEERELA